MTLARFPARHVHNGDALRTSTYGEAARRVVSLDRFADAWGEIRSWPGYAPTPLVTLPGLAGELALGSVRYKDESRRFGLKSFKALGGAYAVLRVLQKHLSEHHGLGRVSAADLVAGQHRDLCRQVTVACATDGNHGRSVAWGAQMFGCRCTIYLHSHVSPTREREIARYDAEIVRVSGNYDDSVRQCAADASANGWVLIADTSAGGDDVSVPATVMQGYTVLAQEMLDQLEESATHVFVQGGVGGLAGAVAGHLWETLGEARPRIVVVEPTRADCIYRSIEAGKPTPVPGDFDTFMACLAAGEISPAAWPLLKSAVDDVITLPDESAAEAMQLLARGVAGDPALVSGESGAAAAAGLIAAGLDADLARALGLDAASRVVVIGSEGATDEESYFKVVGEASQAVEARAA